MIDLSRIVWDLPVAVIDFESTGVDESRKAVEVACVRFEQGMPAARFSSLVNPGIPIPAEATAVHHITDACVANSPSLVDCASDIIRVCAGAIPCAYNAPFDRFILHQAISGSECLAIDPSASWLDPLIMIRDIDRFSRGKGRHRLENACARRGIIINGAHRAESDALATGFLFWRLRERIGDISATDLIRRCEARRKAQDAEFAEWQARQPKSAE